MSDENKGGGSSLDIFEGLGKTSSEKVPVAPSGPPGSSSHLQTGRTARFDQKRTLMGIPGPAVGVPPEPASTRPSTSGLMDSHPQSGSVRAANGYSNGASKSDPPPGRGSLPNLPTSKSNPPIEAPPANPRGSATQRVASEPPPRPHNPAPRHHSSHPPPAIVKTRTGKLDHDPYTGAEDDAADTHVFHHKDVENAAALAPTAQFEAVAPQTQVPSTQNAGGSGAVLIERDLDTLVASSEQRAASQLASSAPAKPIPEPVDTASLSAAFGALGEPEASEISAKGVRSAPISSGMRSAPPPPPPSMQKAGLMTQPMMQPPPPPPPGSPNAAPGMSTLLSMQQVPSPAVPPPPMTQPLGVQPAPAPFPSPPSVHPSAPPPAVSSYPHSLPPVARFDETYTFPKKEPRNSAFYVALVLTVLAVSAAVVFFFTPRTGTLVVNVADLKGGPVQKLEISVDGAKKCDSAPCILHDMSAGTHSITISAPGYDPVASRAVNVEASKDVTSDFQLVAAKATTSSTGFKVAGPVGAKLSVDGKDVGVLPQEIKDLAPGDHKLHFSGDRYAALDKIITVAKDEMVDVGSVPLKVTKGKATIQLGTPGAKVTLVMGTTRKEVPQFPMAIEFDPAEKWELQATKDGFDPYSEKINFEDGQAEKTFNVMLAPKGTAAKAAAASTPNAPKVKTSTATSDVSEPAPKPSKNTSASHADPSTSAETALKINSLPASSVVLDGKPIGVTPLPHVTVSPGSHTITFINSEESLKKTITVDVKAGETKPAFAKLRE